MRRILLLTCALSGFMILSSIVWPIPANSVVTAQSDRPTLRSAFTTDAPMIDGVFQNGEWDEATLEQFSFFMVDINTGEETRFIPADLYLMNDQRNLYLGLSIIGVPYNNPGIAGSGFDAVFLLFDNDDDGLAEAGEDQKILLTIQPNIDNAQRGAYADDHVAVSDDDNEADMRINGLGRIVHSNVNGSGNYTVELSVPLDSGDPFDISTTPEGQLRFNLILATQIGGALEAGSFFDLEFEDSSGWGAIELQPGQAPPEPEPLSGMMTFVTNELGDGRQIYVMNADGTDVTQRTRGDRLVNSPSLSPDGQTIVYTSRDPEPDRFDSQEIFTINATRGRRSQRLTNNAVAESQPVFSPDGRDIAFVRGGNIWIMNANGRNQRQLTDLGADGDPGWTSDGRIVFTSVRWTELPEVAVMNTDGSHVTRITDNEKGSFNPRVSPDGLWVTFFRYDGPGDLFDFDVSFYHPWNIYRIRIDGTEEQRLTDDGLLNFLPTFSPDGGGILYIKILDVSTFYTGLYFVDLTTGQQRRVLNNVLSRVADPVDWRQ